MQKRHLSFCHHISVSDYDQVQWPVSVILHRDEVRTRFVRCKPDHMYVLIVLLEVVGVLIVALAVNC